MNKLLSVTLNDLRITFADRTVWIGLVAIPIVVMFFIGLANGGFSSNQPTYLVDVIDQDGGSLTAQFLTDLQAANGSIVLCPLANNADDICEMGETDLTPELTTTRLNDNVTSAVIEIPENFSAQALAGDPVNIVYRSKETLGQTSPVLQAVRAVTQRLVGAVVASRVGGDAFEKAELTGDMDRAAFVQAVYDRANNIWAALSPVVTYSESGRQQTSGFSQSVPGIATMYVLGNVLAGAIVIITERKQWTLQRLFMMPVSPGQIIGGKMLARFLTGMIQYWVLFGFGLILGVRYGDSPLAIVLIMAVFSLCSTALALLLGTFVTTEQQAGVALNLIILTFAPLGGAWWPLEIMPQWMQVVGHASPIAWAMDGFRTVIFHGGGLQEVIVPVLVLLGITVVCFAIAIRRFRYE